MRDASSRRRLRRAGLGSGGENDHADKAEGLLRGGRGELLPIEATISPPRPVR